MARVRPHPFVDTNVIFSGLYNPAGPPGQILSLHVQGHIRIAVSNQVLTELVRNVSRKHPEQLALLQNLLISAPPEVVADPAAVDVRKCEVFINATDAPIVAAAVACHADCIVTGNTRDFTTDVARQAAIRILTPAEYLADLSDNRLTVR